MKRHCNQRGSLSFLRISMLFLLIPLSSFVFGLTYNVTVPTGTKACYIAGEMNGWTQQAMNKVAETHYSTSILNLNTENLNNKGLLCGSTVALNWTSDGIQNIKIEYSPDNGTNWTIITPSVAASLNAYNWTVPSFTSTTCKIRISDVANSNTKSESSLFSIAPAITYVTFSVDASILIRDGKFNSATDKLYIRGSFNGFDLTHMLNAGSNNIYSLTIALPSNTYVGYKYFSTAASADNGGWEIDFPVTSAKNRSIYVGENNLTLATVYYNDGDMNLSKSTAHFNVIYSSQDNNLIDQFVERINLFHSIVTSSLEVILLRKQIFFYIKIWTNYI